MLQFSLIPLDTFHFWTIEQQCTTFGMPDQLWIMNEAKVGSKFKYIRKFGVVSKYIRMKKMFLWKTFHRSQNRAINNSVKTGAKAASKMSTILIKHSCRFLPIWRQIEDHFLHTNQKSSFKCCCCCFLTSTPSGTVENNIFFYIRIKKRCKKKPPTNQIALSGKLWLYN